MKGTIFMLLNTVFVLMLLACLLQDYRTGKGLWSKTYHILLLMMLKMDMALAHTMEYIHLALEKHISAYHYNPLMAERVREKEQYLMEYSRQMKSDIDGYQKRTQYRRKLLR